ncbi:MAG: hypothetical protein HW386_522 [Gammaproteobacteria bacterium]|nr:hypothetical protein [Gammaproteobacteria bacterium]
MNKMLYTILLLLACSLSVWAEDDNTGQQRDLPADTDTTEKKTPEAAAVAPATNAPTPDSFTPSEEVSEDLSVSFPVDI